MSMRVATCDKTAMVGSSAELVGMVSVAVHAVPDSLLFPFPLRMIQRLQPQCPLRNVRLGPMLVEL